LIWSRAPCKGHFPSAYGCQAGLPRSQVSRPARQPPARWPVRPGRRHGFSRSLVSSIGCQPVGDQGIPRWRNVGRQQRPSLLVLPPRASWPSIPRARSRTRPYQRVELDQHVAGQRLGRPAERDQALEACCCSRSRTRWGPAARTRPEPRASLSAEIAVLVRGLRTLLVPRWFSTDGRRQKGFGGRSRL